MKCIPTVHLLEIQIIFETTQNLGTGKDAATIFYSITEHHTIFMRP
jgi:hypothetical protein